MKRPVRRWLVRAWWGDPRYRSQHSMSMVVWEGVVLSTTRKHAKEMAALRLIGKSAPRSYTALTASPVPDTRPAQPEWGLHDA